MKIALLPGHARKSEGATVCAGYYESFGEFALASHYLPQVRECLECLGHDAVITCRENAGGTTPSYSAKAANATGANLALEWHFNSVDDPKTAGCEVLYWGRSEKSQLFAEKLSARMARILGVPNRGAKPVTDKEDRGYSAFHKSRMPFFMLEPCFAGSNDAEARAFGLAITERWFQRRVAHAVNECLNEVYGKESDHA